MKRTEGVSTTDIVGKLLLMCKDIKLQQLFIGRSQNKVDYLSELSLKEELVILDESNVNLTSTDVKLLTTTARIKQFSNGRILTVYS